MNNIASKTTLITESFTKLMDKVTSEKVTIAISSLIQQSSPQLLNLGINSLNSGQTLKRASYEQNIRRLLKTEIINPYLFASCTLGMFSISNNIQLVIDRTNYAHGKLSINFFVLAFVHQNTAIPLYWFMLNNKGGNSNSDQRINLISWFTSNFPNISIAHIYADREFPSLHFMDWLNSQNITYIFRIKGSAIASDGNKKVKISALYKNSQCNKPKYDNQIRGIYGNRTYLSVAINNKQGQVFLVSNQHSLHVFQLYKQRWTIENMFGKFKTKGLNLESSKLNIIQRIDKLFLILAIAYVIITKVGDMVNTIKPIIIKKIKEANNNLRLTPMLSLFNCGYFLLKILFNNYLFDRVVMRQLHKIINYPPDSITIKPNSKLWHIIMNY